MPRRVRRRASRCSTRSLFLAGGMRPARAHASRSSRTACGRTPANAGQGPRPSPAFLATCKQKSNGEAARARRVAAKRPDTITQECQKVFDEAAVAATSEPTGSHDPPLLEVYSLLGLALLTLASSGLGWVMAGTGPAAGARHHRGGPAGVGSPPRRAAWTSRAPGRAQGAGRHLRRHARPPRPRLRRPAPIRGQRIARTAHAPHRHAHCHRRHPGQTPRQRRSAGGDGRKGAALDRPRRGRHRRAVDPGGQQPGRGRRRTTRPGDGR